MEEKKEQESRKSGSGNNNKKIFLGIAVICLVIAVVAIVYIVRYYSSLNEGNEVYEFLQSSVVEVPEPETTEETSSAAEESTQEEELEEAMTRIVDFDKLTTETNKDIYAWIYIPDTNIDYPVLQHPTDDTYYLNYNLDGSKGYPGCIYTEKLNAKDFSDFNTVLYGHNMKNGTMFHDLHNYKDALFLEEHPYVYVYLPDRILKYQIFAAYQYDDRHLLYSFDYASEKGREGYLYEIMSKKSMSSVIDDSAEVTADSHIITMSTCVGGQSANRFLVQAVLLEDINE